MNYLLFPRQTEVGSSLCSRAPVDIYGVDLDSSSSLLVVAVGEERMALATINENENES